MIGALTADVAVDRRRQASSLESLLQVGLRVWQIERLRGLEVDPRFDDVSSGRQSAVDEHCSDNGFKRAGEEGLLVAAAGALFAAAEAEGRTKVEAPGAAGERLVVHHV